jgi:hypothetical protein
MQILRSRRFRWCTRLCMKALLSNQFDRLEDGSGEEFVEQHAQVQWVGGLWRAGDHLEDVRLERLAYQAKVGCAVAHTWSQGQL